MRGCPHPWIGSSRLQANPGSWAGAGPLGTPWAEGSPTGTSEQRGQQTATHLHLVPGPQPGPHPTIHPSSHTAGESQVTNEGGTPPSMMPVPVLPRSCLWGSPSDAQLKHCVLGAAVGPGILGPSWVAQGTCTSLWSCMGPALGAASWHSVGGGTQVGGLRCGPWMEVNSSKLCSLFPESLCELTPCPERMLGPAVTCPWGSPQGAFRVHSRAQRPGLPKLLRPCRP